MENKVTTTQNGIVPEGLNFSVDNLINLNKMYMSDIVKMATESVTEGNYDPIKALVYAKKGQELFTQLEKAIRPIAEDAQRLAKGEVYDIHNSVITQKETGVKYDFTSCNDSEYNSLKERFDILELELKCREAFLKNVHKDMEQVDTETGETYTIHPPIRSGKLGLAISIK